MLPEPTAEEPPLPQDDEFTEIQRLSTLLNADAAAPLQAAIRRAEASQQAFHLAFAQIGMARALCASDPVAALGWGRKSLEATRALGSLQGQAMALGAIALASRERGALADCLAALEEALQIERTRQDQASVVRLLTNLSTPLERVGRRDAALHCLDEALELVPHAHDPRRLRIINNTAAALASWARHERDEGLPAAQWRPRAERAVALARQLLALPESIVREGMRTVNYPRGCLAKALVVLDELGEALPLLVSLRSVYAAEDDNYALIYVQLELARAWMQQGRPEPARQLARESIALAEQRQVEHFLDDLHLVLSQACEAAGDTAEALRTFRIYHRMKLRDAVARAEDQARSLAVRLDTARAQRESRRDPLTGLHNRRAFDEALAAELSRAAEDQPLSLLMIDLDHFKAVNDRDGHLRGDQALELLGKTLERCCRAHDTAARLGGDEFALLGMMDADSALRVADRLRHALRADSLASWPDRAPLALSIGIATTHRSATAEALLQRADSALYAAKAAGRDTARIG